MIIDSAVGPSPFTLDPNRHMILEAAVTIPASVSIPPPVPDRDTAAILVNAFFTNVSILGIAGHLGDSPIIRPKA